MDEDREERRKESIDEILSDLNGLLNKMPAILEGIRLPEINPVEFLSPRLPEPDAVFPGPEPSGTPCEKDQVFRSAKPEPGKTERRTPLSEPMSYPIEPAGLKSAPELPEIKPSAAGAEEEKDPAYDLESLKEEEAAIENAFKQEPEKEKDEKAPALFEGTRDFGVPDIDTLIRLSQEEALPAGQRRAEEPAGPEFVDDGKEVPAGLPDSADLGPAAAGPGSGGPPVVTGAAPAGEPEKQAEPAPEMPPPAAIQAQPEPVFEPAPAASAAPAPALESAPDNAMAAPRAGSSDADGGGGFMDIKEENPGKEELPEPAAGIDGPFSGPAEPAPQAPQVPAPGAAETVEPRLERSEPQEFTLERPEPEAPVVVVEQPGAGLDANIPPAAPADNDKTMVVPLSAVRPEEEKTVIYEAGAEPGTNPGALQRGAGALGALADKPVPDGIPAERVRTVAFLYAQGDAGQCADMLAELDSVCLKSPSTPMFLKRGFVLACTPGVGGSVYLQKVADAGAVGLILAGDVPQENVYEIENVFTAGGVFFRHFPRGSFNHAAALDLVTEFILK
ncbi:MAG: hypothetical protein WCW52_01775 [Elusimicrobiales bacterium]|jgi:hypothetical protein